MRARDAMTRHVVWVDPEYNLADAAELMKEWNIRHLPVVANNQVVGVLSDRDVLLRSSLDADGCVVVDNGSSVGEVMSPDPHTCSPRNSVGNLAATMVERKIDSLPVVDDSGELLGLVTSTDLLEILIAREQEAKLGELPLKFQVIGGASRILRNEFAF